MCFSVAEKTNSFFFCAATMDIIFFTQNETRNFMAEIRKMTQRDYAPAAAAVSKEDEEPFLFTPSVVLNYYDIEDREDDAEKKKEITVEDFALWYITNTIVKRQDKRLSKKK